MDKGLLLSCSLVSVKWLMCSRWVTNMGRPLPSALGFILNTLSGRIQTSEQ